MNKTSKAAIFIIVLLIVVFLAALSMNKSEIESRRALLESSTIEVISEDQSDMVGLEVLQYLGLEEFEAVLDTSSTDASLYKYSGVQLVKLLASLGYEIDGKDMIIATGADGFSVAYSGEEVLEDGNIYIAVMEEGKYLGGIEDGGSGPYEIIVINDSFSNRRCKWITGIEVVR